MTAKHTIWISHRGLVEYCNENSLASFTNAVKQGFENLETDLRLTGDGELVLCHDRNLSRLAGASIEIAQSSRAKLHKVTLKHGGRLLFFDEFASTFAECNWVFDIKPENGLGTIDAMLSFAERNIGLGKLAAKSKFLMWNEEQESYLRSMLPVVQFYARKTQAYRAGLALLTGSARLAALEKSKIYALSPQFLGIRLFRKELVERYHQYGIRTLAFLPRNQREVDLAVAANFDEILTDGKRGF